jgi:hypothetical protein
MSQSNALLGTKGPQLCLLEDTCVICGNLARQSKLYNNVHLQELANIGTRKGLQWDSTHLVK